ncbi:hypothetical protein C0J52_07223 [Blattella germanica]|nr:hypothetical protein C0J52_07223 [Blattella germanica]
MLLSRILCAVPLLFCLIPDLTFSQDATTTPPVAALPTEEPPPDGFFRRIFYNLKKMFFGNRHQNMLSVQQVTDLWNQSLTVLAEDINGIKSEIEGIGGEFGDVASGLKDPNKDMIGKVLSIGASGVTVFADSLGLVNQIAKILNDFYQAFNRIGDHLYYNAERNYLNWSKMISYVPREIIAKLIEIFQQILIILNKIKAIVVAAHDQIQVAMLQLSIKYTQAALPFHRALVFVNNQIQTLVKAIVGIILQVHKSLVDTILNIQHATSNFVKGAIENTSKGLKNLNLRPKGVTTTGSQETTVTAGMTTVAAKP